MCDTLEVSLCLSLEKANVHFRVMSILICIFGSTIGRAVHLNYPGICLKISYLHIQAQSPITEAIMHTNMK